VSYEYVHGKRRRSYVLIEAARMALRRAVKVDGLTQEELDKVAPLELKLACVAAGIVNGKEA
jgi:hypothetical protein